MTTVFDSSDLVVGITEEVAQAEEIGGASAVQSIDEDGFLGTDGIYVHLGASWSEHRMRLEPQTRL